MTRTCSANSGMSGYSTGVAASASATGPSASSSPPTLAPATLGQFDQPLRGDNPLINSTSNLKVAIRASGTCDGEMRVSIARIDFDENGIQVGYTPRFVKSNTESENLMVKQQQKFVYGLTVDGTLQGTGW